MPIEAYVFITQAISTCFHQHFISFYFLSTCPPPQDKGFLQQNWIFFSWRKTFLDQIRSSYISVENLYFLYSYLLFTCIFLTEKLQVVF